MTNDEKLMQQALDALQECVGIIGDPIDVIEVLRDRLAQPEPEPDKYLMEIECTKCGAKQDGILTVTSPPQHEWQGLTDDEIAQLMFKCDVIVTGPTQFNFAYAIEAKLKEKNNA